MNLDAGGDAGPAVQGPLPGRSEVTLLDAEGGSNISGTEVFAMIIGLILAAAFVR